MNTQFLPISPKNSMKLKEFECRGGGGGGGWSVCPPMLMEV